jgi:hypothetical protein
MAIQAAARHRIECPLKRETRPGGLADGEPAHPECIRRDGGSDSSDGQCDRGLCCKAQLPGQAKQEKRDADTLATRHRACGA